MPPATLVEPKRRSIVVGQTALSFSEREEEVELANGFAATINGLVVTGSPRLDRWAAPLRKLAVFEKGAQFAIGDAVRLLRDRFGEESAQLIDPDLGWSLKTINLYSWMSERIPLENRRMDRLGVKHHLLVAALTPAKQRQWLTRAAADEEEQPWTAARLKKALEEGEDLPVEKWFILVGPLTSGQVQSDLMDRLEAEGLSVKAIDRRRRKATEPAT